MQLTQAISLLQSAVPAETGEWADIGAGTGLFTQALDQILGAGSTVFALDKNPHSLWYLRLQHAQLRVEEGDFTRKLLLPVLSGMVMANALHYAPNPGAVLTNLRAHLKPEGRLVLVEYDTDRPNPPWVPFPISRARLPEIAMPAGFAAPTFTADMPSAFGHAQIYVAVLEVGDGE
ncbi:MAG: class I SAM-dependent methyltransferase [Bacteroidota bacterium]